MKTIDSYDEILKIWEGQEPDEFEIHSQLYYAMFADIYEEKSDD